METPIEATESELETTLVSATDDMEAAKGTIMEDSVVAMTEAVLVTIVVMETKKSICWHGRKCRLSLEV